MTLQILVGLSVVNFFSIILSHLMMKRFIKNHQLLTGSKAPEQQMNQIEDNLNERLRMLQTAQFSPRMRGPYIRLVNDEGDE
mgnify:CR=1 FL=1